MWRIGKTTAAVPSATLRVIPERKPS